MIKSVFLSNIHYLIGITIVLNIATASPAFVVIEVPMREGNTGEVLPVSTEPASAWGVGTLSTASSAHVIDDSVHIDVDLWVDTGL